MPPFLRGVFSFARSRGTTNQHQKMAMDLIISGQSTITFTIFGSFLFLYAIFSLSRSLRNKTPHRKPPLEAGGAWPVIGHLHLLGGPEPPYIALAKMADKYGPIFSLRLGVHPTLIVSSWEIAKECFTVNDLAFAGRPKILAFEVMGYNFGMFAMFSYGPHYCHMRNSHLLVSCKAFILKPLLINLWICKDRSGSPTSKPHHSKSCSRHVSPTVFMHK